MPFQGMFLLSAVFKLTYRIRLVSFKGSGTQNQLRYAADRKEGCLTHLDVDRAFAASFRASSNKEHRRLGPAGRSSEEERCTWQIILKAI